MLWTSRRSGTYLRRTPDDRILLGIHGTLPADLDLVETARLLQATAVEIFPELDDAKSTHAWTGTIGMTFDQLPHIGRIDGMWYALGYNGNGVAMATYVGTQVGRLITGELDRSPFADIPHPTRPYYRRSPWFRSATARWNQLRDRIGR